jgi:hypothetical protein
VTAAARWPRRCVIHGWGCKVAARYRNASGPPRALCAEAEKAQAVVAFLRARSAESWAMPALTRQQKITFGEMRGSGVRGVLVYCSDYRCSHSTTISADQWSNDVRLSDIEPQFICHAAREAPTSAPIGLRPKLTHENRRPVVASCDLLCPSLPPCDPYHSHGRCCG